MDVTLATSSHTLRANTVKTMNNLICQEGKRVLFVSNNSRMSRSEMGAKLIEMGVEIPTGQINRFVLNTAFTCAWFLKRRLVKKPFILCSHTGVLKELKEMGMLNYVATIHDNGSPK